MSTDRPKKPKMLDLLADENGVAIVVVDEASRDVSVSNNNSMCRNLYGSKEFAPSCAKYCGMAYEWATEAGGVIEYECYAGITCRALPVVDAGKQYVAIVGRVFLKAENYRVATERALTGEWRQFKPTDFFENVLISGSDANLKKVVERLSKFAKRERDDILEIPGTPGAKPKPKPAPVVTAPEPPRSFEDTLHPAYSFGNGEERSATTAADDAQEIAEWRSFFGSIMNMDYEEACSSILGFLGERYGLKSLVWLERREDRLEGLVAHGRLKGKTVKIGISPDSDRLLLAAISERPLELRERQKTGTGTTERTLSLFPLVVGDEIRGAVGIEDTLESDEQKRSISRLAQTVASQMEILRLRDEVSRRDWLSQAVRRFNESLKQIDADDFWLRVTQVSAELLSAERASLLIRSEKSDSLRARAAFGSRINLLTEENLGARVARVVLNSGEPIVASDIRAVGIESAPPEWSYKTPSFISYPILLAGRRIGVMNFTDRADGMPFSERDLELLQAIAPQIAVAIDHTTLRDRAGEFEQLSVTDPLTGLLNRRYLEERLHEEITRSKRHRFPMSLMMLDVDNFKSYNDSYGHPAGDTALKLVAGILKETLRGADVAARFGGEEFAILLPQTSSDEAAVIAERLRHRIELTEFPKRKVTVSIGIASCSNDIDNARDLLSAADVALYEAKNRGRNNVQVFNNFGNSLTENIH